MKQTEVSTHEQLQHLYDNSALTSIGLDLSGLDEYVEWVEENSKETVSEVFVISGKLMNSNYDLHGDNAYPDDLNIVSIVLGAEGLSNIAIKRFELGSRWFDDIVDNNSRRECDEEE